MMAKNNQAGIIGLGTMGGGIAASLSARGYDVTGLEPLAAETPSARKKAAAGRYPLAARTADLVTALAPPRRILMMVPAGQAVEDQVAALSPLLAPGDVLIDGGNSHFADTARRAGDLASTGIHFLGCGISGGEKGARDGASVMAGGPRDGFLAARDILEAIAAHDERGACCAWFGDGGAGHFVKMVHNGIEYAVMQAIGEAWMLLRDGLGLEAAAIAACFDDWNETGLRSWLLEMSAAILRRRDDLSSDGMALDAIDDAAAQTGTGQWAVSAAMALGAPVPTIAAAVMARSLSGMGAVRKPSGSGGGRDIQTPDIAPDQIAQTLFGATMIAFAQGADLIRAGAGAHGWPIRMDAVARVWRNGCILRSRLLGDIEAAYAREPELAHLLRDSAYGDAVAKSETLARPVLAAAARAAIPLPAMASAFSYLQALRRPRLWTALTQAQRDMFGAHGYRRIDRGGSFHTDWEAEN